MRPRHVRIPPTQSVVRSYPTYRRTTSRARIPPTQSVVRSYFTYRVSLPFQHQRTYPSTMYLTPYTALAWAYQLHYHLCFRTHRRRELSADKLLARALTELYQLHGYHELERKVRKTDVQLLLSLRPEHAISDVLKKLKGGTSTALCRELEISPPILGARLSRTHFREG